MTYQIEDATIGDRQIVARRARALLPRLQAAAPLHSKLIRSINTTVTPHASDGLYLRLSYLTNELLDESRNGEPIDPDLKRLLGMMLVDSDPYELDARGHRVKTGPKPRTPTEDWENAGLETRGPGRPVGADSDRRRGHEISVTDEAWDYAKDQGNASQFIESLIQQDKNGK